MKFLVKYPSAIIKSAIVKPSINTAIISLSAITLFGCASSTSNTATDISSTKQPQQISVNHASQCLGTTELANSVAGDFVKIEDPELLNRSLGQTTKGMLCQGQVYQTTAESKLTIYRAWNSTNPNSQFGQWWAFNKPSGSTAKYREEYEICYQWSPLDKLVTCTLKPNTKVVVGTGQSAECSQYLSYPVSASQQIYIENADQAVINCSVYHAEFSWKQ